MADRLPDRARADRENTRGGALEAVGIVCARAAIVAIAMGLGEGWVIGRMLGGSVSGMGLAVVGLWVPASFVALLAATPLVAIGDKRRRVTVLAALAVALVGALVFAGVAHVSLPVRAAPLEVVSAIMLAWAASILRFEGTIRKPAAYVGVGLAVAMQLFATRWVDAHRPYAAAIADTSFVPRLMLKTVLRRVI